MIDGTVSKTISKGTFASRRNVLTVATTASATAFLGSAQAQTTSNQVRIFNPPGVAKPVGYSHIAEVSSGRTVYIAGQTGVDPNGNLAGAPGDFPAQATQVFENMKSVLAAVGGSFDNLVKLNAYFIDMETHLPIFREVRDKYVSKDTPPPSTVVQVGRLARAQFLLEVEGVAVLPA